MWAVFGIYILVVLAVFVYNFFTNYGTQTLSITEVAGDSVVSAIMWPVNLFGQILCIVPGLTKDIKHD